MPDFRIMCNNLVAKAQSLHSCPHFSGYSELFERFALWRSHIFTKRRRGDSHEKESGRDVASVGGRE